MKMFIILLLTNACVLASTINELGAITVSGQVTDTEGTPVEEARITFTNEADTSKAFSGMTDMDGRYRVMLEVITVVEEEAVSAAPGETPTPPASKPAKSLAGRTKISATAAASVHDSAHISAVQRVDCGHTQQRLGSRRVRLSRVHRRDGERNATPAVVANLEGTGAGGAVGRAV